MRIFVALFVPDAVRDAVVGAMDALRSPGDGVSWVKPENLHYTLRFLGELGEDGTRRVGEAVEEAARARAPFDLALGRLGCFPHKGPPRVLWVGASQGAEALEAYARDLEQGLRGRGFDHADHPFRAHLTIGRVRDARGGPARAPSRDWRAALGAVALQTPTFRVERIAVVQSQLSPKGSIYTVLRQAGLGR
jgi:2'-5' RNA ligase